jgi:phosphoribosylanthranilate isomerase
MRVKICGLTRKEDALLAQQLGAWALGFVFYPKSPRHVSASAVKAILEGMAAPAIGVFVNQMEDVAVIAKEANLSGIQLHGDETPEDCQRIRENFDGFLIKALQLRDQKDLAQIDIYKNYVDYILVDAVHQGQYGGTGQTADWSLAALAARQAPVILAGGLNDKNILAAATQVSPYALDLSSGVETSPSIKDPIKIRNLFTIAQGD